ncbi:MAG: cohesin domain-containing protein [Methanophagales archaeon]|nr:cohesin domain-containing protein [Methanophagales archaeon]
MKGKAFRDITVMLVILMASMALVAPASSSSTIVSIESKSVTVGQSVTLQLMVEGADEPISSARLVLSYDPAICEVTSVEEGQFDFFESTIDKEKGELNIIGYGIEELREDFKIADIAFKAKKEGVCNLGVDILELKNSKGNPVHAKTESGSLIAEAPPSDEEGMPKSTPTITPTTTPALPSPTPPISPTPSFTPASSPPPITTTTPTPLIPSTSIAVVHIGNFSVAEGKLCNAAIIIKNIGESGISRADITLEFNPSVVKIESARGSEFDRFAWDVPSEGKLMMFAFENDAKAKREIKFVELKLRAIGRENESSELGLEVGRLKDGNNQDIPFEVENGYLWIKPSRAIPTLSVFETIAVTAWLYFFIRLRRRK